MKKLKLIASPVVLSIVLIENSLKIYHDKAAIAPNTVIDKAEIIEAFFRLIPSSSENVATTTSRRDMEDVRAATVRQMKNKIEIIYPPGM